MDVFEQMAAGTGALLPPTLWRLRRRGFAAWGGGPRLESRVAAAEVRP